MYEVFLGRMNAMDIGDDEVTRASYENDLAASFVRIDRRRLVAAPDADRDEFLEQLRGWNEVGGHQPQLRVDEVIDVLGDRLALVRLVVEFESGISSEQNQVLVFDDSVERLLRIVSFDPDDVDAATTELHRVAAELQRGPG